MAALTINFVVSRHSVIGRRTVGSILPIRESANFAGAGLGSTNKSLCKRSSLAFHSRAVLKSPAKRALWNAAYCAGAIFDPTDIVPCPPWALCPSEVGSSPESWIKSSPHLTVKPATRSISPVASLQVLENTFLAWFVIVRRHNQSRIRPHSFRMLGIFD